MLLVLVSTVLGQALSPISTLSVDSQARFKAIFEQARPYADLGTAQYAILGFKLLSTPVPQAQVNKQSKDQYHNTFSMSIGSIQLKINLALNRYLNDFWGLFWYIWGAKLPQAHLFVFVYISKYVRFGNTTQTVFALKLYHPGCKH